MSSSEFVSAWVSVMSEYAELMAAVVAVALALRIVRFVIWTFKDMLGGGYE